MSEFEKLFDEFKEEQRLGWDKHDKAETEFRRNVDLKIDNLWTAMRKGLDEIADKITSLVGDRSRTETDWKTMALFITIVLALCTIFGTQIKGLSDNMVRTETHFDTLIEKVDRESKTRHYDQDATLQREMRILSDVRGVEIQGLDVRLQSEMRMLNSVQDERVQQLRKDLDRVDAQYPPDWLTEKVDQIERDLRTLEKCPTNHTN